MKPDQALHDLTLALIYLTRFTDRKEDFFKTVPFQAWKNYDWNTIDKLDEEGLVTSKHKNKSLWLTEEGVVKAREVLNSLGIDDWRRDT